MRQFTRYDMASGRISGFILVQTQEEAETSLWLETDAIVEGLGFENSHYVLDGVITDRPSTGLPAAHTLPANTDWIVPAVPEGTVVEIDGEEVGTVDATGLTLAFDLAGIWQVNLRLPFPWLNASCEVTVT